MAVRTTPITIIESYFDQHLERSTLRWFDEVPDDHWIDFAKQYMATMRQNFAQEFFQIPPASSPSLRLYFEPRMGHEWERAVAGLYQPTPLLGLNHRPPSQQTITRDEVSKMLDPLKKHLLLADSIYFRDSFYSCFDAVADSVDRNHWRSDPNVPDLVHSSIRSLKDWLPILIELRTFIESGALVFMPYYLTPSFPSDTGDPAINEHYKKLRIHPDPTATRRTPPVVDLKNFFERLSNPPPRKPTRPDADQYFSESEVMTAWLNARILDLDPVFPSRAMSDLAGRLYFDEGPDALDVTSDLISVEVLPFGRTEGIHLDQLWEMRKNEDVFASVQRAAAGCKKYIEKNAGPGTTKQGVDDMCRTFLHDELDKFERSSSLRFLRMADENKAVGIALSMALGFALLPLNPPLSIAIGLTVAAPFLSPETARAIQDRFNPTERAYGHLQALL
jgi:hypothetical protein